MTDQAKKDLRIKTGSCSRLLKEYLSYFKEEVQEQERYNKMKEDGVEEQKLKQQKTVLDETSQMIPYCKNKVQGAYKELKALVEQLSGQADVEQLEEFTAAQQLLSEIESQDIMLQ